MRSIHYSWLAIALLACGDDGVHHLADGGPDGPVEFDAPPTNDPVTVTVTNGGSAAAGVKVYFLNADSSVVSNTTTGADGNATAVMDAGGTVTVIEPQSLDTPQLTGRAFTGGQLDTFAGVKPGDHLFVEVGGGSTQNSATFNVTIPTDPNPATTDYELFTNCGGASLNPPLAAGKQAVAISNPPVSVTLFGCGATADWFITGSGIGSGSAQQTDFIFAPDTAVVDGQDVSLDPATFTYDTFATRTVTASNMDTPATAFSPRFQLFTDKGSLQFDGNGNQGTGSAGTAITSMQVPSTTTGITGLLDFEFDFDGTVAEVFQDIEQWGPLPNADIAVDYGATRLKHVSTSPTFDTATQTLSWTVDTANGGLDGDAFLTVVSGDRVDQASGADTFWQWTIISGDPNSGTVTFPTLPTDVFDFAFQDTDNPSFGFLDIVKIPGGYDTIRGLAFTDFQPTDLSATGLVQAQVVFNRATAFAATPSRPATFNHKNLFAPTKRTNRAHVHVTHGAGTMRK